MQFKFFRSTATGDEAADGACQLIFQRHASDRRFWVVCPYGDNAERGGIYPLVRCVMNDFGNLVATEALPS